MKIAIFGASGKTGIEVVKQALEKGFEVNAFVRNVNKLQITNSSLKLFTGDVLNPTTFSEVLNGVEAVVITLSGILAGGIKNIIDEMKSKSVKKLILMSSYPMNGTPEAMSYLKSAVMPDEKIQELTPIIDDKIEQEKLVKESGLNWTIVLPTFLKDGSKTEKYQILENAKFTVKNGITRSDVAHFIIRALTENMWDNKVISISN